MAGFVVQVNGTFIWRMESAKQFYNQLKELAKQNYNPHNQFLQIAVEIGVLGLGLFIFLLFKLLEFSRNNKNYLLFILTTGLIFNSLFESMLQRQSGIVFYSFWICLIVAFSETFEKSNKSDDLT